MQGSHQNHDSGQEAAAARMLIAGKSAKVTFTMQDEAPRERRRSRAQEGHSTRKLHPRKPGGLHPEEIN